MESERPILDGCFFTEYGKKRQKAKYSKYRVCHRNGSLVGVIFPGRFG